MPPHAGPSKVYKVGWWMGAYGHPTPKRSKGFSNNPWVLKFDKGRLDRARFKDVPQEHKTTRTYVDKSGRTRYVGLPGLKKSQMLAFTMYIHRCGIIFRVFCWSELEALYRRP